MSDAVVVFMDYQNIHGWARRQFLAYGAHPAEGHIDPLATAQLLVKRRKFAGVLKQVRIYRGRPNPDRQPTAAAANDRQTREWETSGLVSVIRRPLYYPPDYPIRPAIEKGVDVSLAVDLVRMGLEGAYQTAIVFSSDTDLMPALETVVTGGLGHVEVAAWSGGHRLRFPNSQTPWCHYINQSTYQTLRDHRDYTAP